MPNLSKNLKCETAAGSSPAAALTLPNTRPLFRRDIMFVAGLDVERLVPFVGVAERREGADLAGAVRPVDDLLAKRIVPPQGPPDLRPGHEHPLFGGEAVEHRPGLAAQEVAIGFEAEMGAAEIGDILAHRDPWVDVHAGQGREVVGGILLAQAGCLHFEFGGVFRLPPVAKHARPIALAALIVEAVSDFV